MNGGMDCIPPEYPRTKDEEQLILTDLNSSVAVHEQIFFYSCLSVLPGHSGRSFYLYS